MAYTRDDLLGMLPFGKRFLMLDDAIVEGDQVVAHKTIAGDEHYLQDHFPDFPCMPGTHTVELMGQAALLLVRPDERHDVVLTRIEDARFFGPIVPPATIAVRVTRKEGKGSKTKFHAVAAVGNEEKAEASFWVARVPRERFRGP